MQLDVKETFEQWLERAQREDEDRIALLRRHLKPIGTGKVRHLFEVPNHPELMVVYVSDAWSAYDFRFGFVIPGKGVILNISTIAAKRIIRKEGKVLVDLVAYGNYIDEYLTHPELRHRRDLQERVTIVFKYPMVLYEIVFRKHLYGTALKTYDDPENHRIVCGQQLPEGLLRFAEFDRMLSSPTTKAKVGHDEQVTLDSVEEREPGLLTKGIEVADILSGLYKSDGIGRLIDGKLEFGKTPRGEYVLCDEVSPDSVRLAAEAEFATLQPGDAPAVFYDKEYGRQWAAARGIQALNPKWKRHRERVASWRPDEAFVTELTRRYREGFRILSRGHGLEEYMRIAMSMHAA